MYEKTSNYGPGAHGAKERPETTWYTPDGHACSGFPFFGPQHAAPCADVSLRSTVAQNSPATARDSPGNPAIWQARGITRNALRTPRDPHSTLAAFNAL
jgi:hypothetical protein